MNKKLQVYIILINLFLVLGSSFCVASQIDGKELVPEKELRIISLAPSITDILVGLGFGENIIAISNYCTDPMLKEKALPRIGIGKAFNIEKSLALKPTLVLGLEELDKGNLPYYRIKTKTLQEVLDSYVTIATLCNNKEKGVEFQKKVIEKIETIKKNFANKQKQKVLFSLETESDSNSIVRKVIASGNDGYFSEILNVFNATNATNSKLDYPVLSYENILVANPDVVIEILPPNLLENYDISIWNNVPIFAVNNKRIYTSSLGVVPGTKLFDFLDELEFMLTIN